LHLDVPVEDEDGVGGGFRQRPVALFADAQGLLRVLRLGFIRDHEQQVLLALAGE
jgi:hypothetical protein